MLTRGAARLRRKHSGPFEPDLVYTSVGKWRTNYCIQAMISPVSIQIPTAFLVGGSFFAFSMKEQKPMNLEMEAQYGKI